MGEGVPTSIVVPRDNGTMARWTLETLVERGGLPSHNWFKTYIFISRSDEFKFKT